MRGAIHPARGFAFRETRYPLSDDEWNFRTASALDDPQELTPSISSRSRIHAELLERFSLCDR